MVLVLFLCIIIMIAMLIIIGILVSTVRIQITDFEVSNVEKVTAKYKVNISALILDKVKWISLNFDKKKIQRMSKKIHLEKKDIQKLEKDMQIEDIKEIINIKPKISLLRLNVKLGVEDVVITSYIVPIICTILAVILPYMTIEAERKNINYKIDPMYNNGNIYYVKLDTVLEIKVINILNAVYRIYKSRKLNKQRSQAILA